MNATATDRMPVLARIDFLAATLHDFAALARDGYGVARVTANIVELAFPNCPAELVHLAIRYTNRAHSAAALHSAYSAVPVSGDITRLAREAAVFAERESAAACEAFEAAMRAHYAPPSE